MAVAAVVIFLHMQADLQLRNAELQEEKQQQKAGALPGTLHDKQMQCLNIPLKPLVVESSGESLIEQVHGVLATSLVRMVRTPNNQHHVTVPTCTWSVDNRVDMLRVSPGYLSIH